MNEDLDNFEPVVKIIVIGVGGAGNNAVNRMIDDNINNVDFYVANTDKQALSLSKAPKRLILGESVTNGLGAGGEPSIGKQAAEASEAEIRDIVKNANLVFIAAGMGGGTGTGAAPVIARYAKDSGALTIAIVTRPFSFEGSRKAQFSIDGLNALKENVDSLIVVSNDKLLINNGKASITDAFSEADKVLARSVKTVSDIILMPSLMNLDFADVRSILKDSGVALIGFGEGQGENASEDAATSALSNPLIEQTISGATKAICHITVGPNISLNSAYQCISYINDASGSLMDIKFGISTNDQLDDQIMVSLIASHFKNDIIFTAPKKEDLNIIKTTINNEINSNQNNNVKEEENEKEEDDIIPSFLNN